MAGRWRSQTTNVQSIVVEACWRPMVGDVAGDFYDVVDLKDGRVAVIVGDAPGYGPRAAALAEELRSEARRALADSTDAAAVLARLDEQVQAGGEEAIATAVCAIIDAEARNALLATAGHLPPLVVTDHSAAFLTATFDTPIGIPSERTVSTHHLPVGTTMFFYTDGLVERRGTSLDDSLTALEDIARGVVGASAWASELARRATQRLGEPADDATVLSVRPLAVGARPATNGPSDRQAVHLDVYVDPRDPRSARTERMVVALANGLSDDLDVRVQVIDVTAAGADIDTHDVLATPTIVRTTPRPPVRVIGGSRSVGELARQLQLPAPKEDP